MSLNALLAIERTFSMFDSRFSKIPPNRTPITLDAPERDRAVAAALVLESIFQIHLELHRSAVACSFFRFHYPSSLKCGLLRLLTLMRGNEARGRNLDMNSTASAVGARGMQQQARHAFPKQRS